MNEPYILDVAIGKLLIIIQFIHTAIFNKETVLGYSLPNYINMPAASILGLIALLLTTIIITCCLFLWLKNKKDRDIDIAGKKIIFAVVAAYIICCFIAFS